MEEKGKFFGESAYYSESNPIEKEEAITYLNFWKNNLLKKLQRDSFSCEVVDEQWVDRPALYNGCLSDSATLALKIYVKADFNYDLEKAIK